MDVRALVAIRDPARSAAASGQCSVARQHFVMVLLAAEFAVRGPLLRGDLGGTTVDVEHIRNGRFHDVPDAVPVESLRAQGNRVNGTLGTLKPLHLWQRS